MKVLIVDDERLICSGLKTLTEHLELPDVTEVHTTTDPVEALHLVREMRPEIVLTDVKMPTMSGLELMERAAAEMPSIRFIVISGYDDFDLVREALKLQATDYLLKPATTDELRGALTRSIASVRERRDRERVQDALVASTIERISNGDIPSAPRLEVLARSVGDLLAGEHLQLAILEAESERVSPAPARVVEIAREVLRDHAVDLLDIRAGETTAYLFAAAAQSSGLDALRAELQRLCRSATGGRLVCTMSSRSRSLELLPILYREAREARKQKLLHSGVLLCYDELDASVSVPAGGVLELEELRVALLSGDRDAACAFVERVPESSWQSVAYLDQLRAIVSEETGRVVVALEDSFRFDTFVQSLREAVCGEPANDAAKIPPSGAQSGANDAAIIAEAKRFVLSDLARNADMSAAAAHVGLSYAYFSTVFKETADVAFSDFVRQARMKEAGRLLHFGHAAVGEVARRVGYRYPKHFTRAFKQYFGVSPREYARAAQIKRGEER